MKNKYLHYFLIFLSYIIITYFIIGLFFLLDNFSFFKTLHSLRLSTTYDAFEKSYISLNSPIVQNAILLSSAVFALIITYLNLKKPFKNVYGDAKFANKKELKNKMDLYKKDGVIIGMDKKNHLLKIDPSLFIALSAPTGSDKTVSFVIPNALEWESSMVLFDAKSELYKLTSKYRKYILKNEIFIFDPFSINTHRYNPLSYVDMENKETRDIELSKITTTLYPLSTKSDNHIFDNGGRSLFKAYVYLCYDLIKAEDDIKYILDFVPEFSLANIYELALSLKIDLEETMILTEINEIISFLDKEGFISKTTVLLFKDFILVKETAPITAGGIWGNFTSPLKHFSELSTVKRATSESDFDLNDLRKKKMTIYLTVTPGNMKLIAPIFKLFWSQLFDINTKEEPKSNKDLKYKTLLIMDEFVLPGYLETYMKSVSFIRSYGLSSAIIHQNNAQLEAPISEGGYGQHGSKTLLANHPCKIYFATENKTDGEDLSKLLGYRTVKDSSFNNSSTKHKFFSGSTSKNINNKKRELMLPQEIMTMDRENQIIRIIGNKPIFCKKAIYFKSKYFVDKLKRVSPYLRSIEGLPEEKEYTHAISKQELEVPLKYLNIKTGDIK